MRDLAAFDIQRDELYADMMEKARFFMHLKLSGHRAGIEPLLLNFILDPNLKVEGFREQLYQALIHMPIRSVIAFTMMADLVG